MVLLEDSLFFGDPHHPARFHRQKLLFHVATLRAYAELLRARRHEVEIREFRSGQVLADQIADLAGRELHCCDPEDFLLEKRLRRFARSTGSRLVVQPGPMFLSPPDWLDEVFGERSRNFRMAEFYRRQRQRLGILVEPDGQPVGGRWSFDEDNRKKLPRGFPVPPDPPARAEDHLLRDARAACRERFPDQPGSDAIFWYPLTHREASAWLDDFLERKLGLFGDYEDAISPGHAVLFHSVLTPLLNVGLLTPAQVVERTLEAAESTRIPLNSLEGFLRQVIGWREFVRAVYRRIGVAQRTANHWGFDRPIPRAFYDGTTGIEPVDRVIRQVLDHAWCHHIERLMVLGNFFCLCGFHPDAVYRWFMELFIDAYDWVMVPNVYGMSQFADGGLITTKPYLSGSNYLRKMGAGRPGPWCATWDGLFWTFIARHHGVFAANPRLSMMARQLDRMPPDKLREHHRNAEAFLDSLG